MSDLNDAAAQLRRVLLALPELDDDKAHALKDIAAAADTDEATLLRDLKTLIERNGDEPAGFQDSVALTVDATTVRLDAPGFFRRPMGLTATELDALELGLAMLRNESPPEEQGTIDRARERVRVAITRVREAPPPAAHAAGTARETEEQRALRKTLGQAIAARVVVELAYRKANASEPESRRVRPLGFVQSRGTWYFIALTMDADELRVFRFDRVTGAQRLHETFELPASFSLADVVRDGRVLSSDADEKLKIRYSPAIARWIAEREELPLDADGAVTVEMPLHDTEWAVRYVLQYGDEAEVIEPPGVREAVRRLLEKL